ncbi:unnamed protein product [Closterium sp. NIES-64]|nr:unnamed protein product [Closterium sp. NIES-64]
MAGLRVVDDLWHAVVEQQLLPPLPATLAMPSTPATPAIPATPNAPATSATPFTAAAKSTGGRAGKRCDWRMLELAAATPFPLSSSPPLRPSMFLRHGAAMRQRDGGGSIGGLACGPVGGFVGGRAHTALAGPSAGLLAGPSAGLLALSLAELTAGPSAGCCARATGGKRKVLTRRTKGCAIASANGRPI